MTLTAGASHTQAQGSWRNNDPRNPSPAQEEGDWTAQAGATVEDKCEGDAAAAAAGGPGNV